MKTDNSPLPPSLPEASPKLATAAVITGALALVITIVLSGAQYEVVTQKGGKWFELASWIRILLSGAALLGIAALVMGLIVIFRSKEQKAWGFTGIALGTLPLLLVATVVVMATSQQVLKVKHSIERAESTANINAYVGKPIPAGPEVFTWQNQRELNRQWYQRNMLEGYRQHGQKNPFWDLAAERFIQSWINSKMEDAKAPDSNQLFAEARQALGAGCKDQLVLYLASLVQFEYSEMKRLSVQAQDGTAQSSHAHAVKWLVAVQACQWLGRSNTEQSRLAEADQQAMMFLKGSLEQGNYQAEEFTLLEQLLTESAGEQWHMRHREEVCQLLETTKQCPEWLASLIRGRLYIDMAWKIRGSGYADTVTAKGWEGFTKNMELAERSLTHSWELNPKDANAAAEMIKVKMGAGDNPVAEVRLWFDRAVAARMDFYPAYNSLLWALRPRWHGSHEVMLRFGETCLQTGRYDTSVPRYYAQAVYDVSEEQNSYEVYREPQVYANLRTVYSNYAAAASDPKVRLSYLTGQYMAAMRATNYADCLKDLEAMKFTPDTSTMLAWRDNSEMTPGGIRLLNSAQRELWLKLVAARVGKRYAEAISLAHELEGAFKGDAFLKKWLEELLVALELEQGLEAGNWVKITPPVELTGWRVYNGDWKVNVDGSVEGRAGVKGMMLKSLAKVGANFALRGEMEILSSTTGDYQAGIVFGNPHPETGNWYGLRVRHSGRDGDEAILSRTFATDLKRTKVTLGRTNTFEFSLQGGEATGKINETQVMTAKKLAQNGVLLHTDLAIGLGAYSDQNEYVIRFRNLEAKRLPAKVKTVQTTNAALPFVSK